MIKRIEVETFIESMGLGVSRPALILADDSNEYILKNEKIDNNGTIQNYNCMFLNEMLAFQIGKYLDVPMPDAAIAHVYQDFIEEDPTLRFAYRFEEGIYFATKKLDNLENNLMSNIYELKNMGKNYVNRTWNSFFKNIDNRNKIVNIIVFDIFIANFDRYRNEGNILISGDYGRNIYAIDHGHAFWGPILDQNKVNAMKNVFLEENYPLKFAHMVKQENGRIFRALCQHIDLTSQLCNPFSDVVSKIEDISEDLIDEWLNNIPNEWYIDKNIQSVYYKNYLLKQKDYVRVIIDSMVNIDLFDNYLGGDLIWKTKVRSNTV